MPSLAPGGHLAWLTLWAPAWGEGRRNLDAKFKDNPQMGMPEQKEECSGRSFTGEKIWLLSAEMFCC